MPKIKSHDVELIHCRYTKRV